MTSVSGSGKRKPGSQSKTVKTQRRTWKAGSPAPDPKTPIGHLVVQRMQEIGENEQGYPLSYRQVAERAARKGFKVSAPTVGNVIRDVNRSPSDETFAGLAAALDCDEHLLRKAWKAGATQEWTLPTKFQRLDSDGWEKLLEFGEFLLNQQRRPSR